MNSAGAFAGAIGTRTAEIKAELEAVMAAHEKGQSADRARFRALAALKRVSFERDLVDTLSSEAIEANKGGSQSVSIVWRFLRGELEREERRVHLQAADEPEFTKAVWWMAQRGTPSDIAFLEKAKSAATGDMPKKKLIDDAIGRIQGRQQRDHSDDPKAVLHDAHHAYQSHKAEWDRKYHGQHIAVVGGEIIDSDPSEHTLLTRLYDRQRREGRFRAGIIHVGEPPVVARGPRIRIHAGRSRRRGASVLDGLGKGSRTNG
jgi:hypothetical protein